MIKFIKKCVFFVIIVILCLIFAAIGYLTYVDSNASKAKNYLLETYEIDNKEWYAIKYTEYIYEDIADCNSLWFKKCTSNSSLLYEYTFINKQNEKIVVKEDQDGNYQVEYNGQNPLKEKEIVDKTTETQENLETTTSENN